MSLWEELFGYNPSGFTPGSGLGGSIPVVGDFVDDTLDSAAQFGRDPFGYTKENVESGLETANNIGSDINTYGRQFAKDAGQLNLDLVKGSSDVGMLLDNPADYFQGLTQPVFGDGQTPGFWDQYGQWTALIPGVGPLVYGVGQGINIANDYHYTGDEEQLRAGARQLGTTLAAGQAGQYAGGELNQLFGPGYTTNMGTAAARSGTSALLGGGDSRNETTNFLASVGGAGLGTALGGSPIYDDSGKVVGYDQAVPNSLNLGPEAYQFGTMGASLFGNTINQKRAEEEFNRNLEDILNSRPGASIAGNFDYSSPELESIFTGSPGSTDMFISEEEKKAQKSKVGFGGPFASGNSQVQSQRDPTYDGQGGTYTL